MRIPFLGSLSLSMLLCCAIPQQQANAQPGTTMTTSYTPWFMVQDQQLIVQTGNDVKPLRKNVTLPNGTRIDASTKAVYLSNGTRMTLKEGDRLSYNGEFIPRTVAPAPDAAEMLASAAPVSSTPSSPTPAVEAPVATTAPAFSYRPPAPVNGKLKGVVELGASGFNMFIIRVDEQRNWKLEQSDFANSLVLENMATEQDIRSGLKAYIGKMLDFGVAGRDIHFVVSSGAALSESARRIVKSLEELQYVVTTVTPGSEGALGLRAALPLGFGAQAFVVDIGSANTKISWLEGKEVKTTDTYGSKYFEKNVDDATVAADVRSSVSQVPAAQRQTCFIIGGVPYELAKAGREGHEPYTVLKPADAYSQLTGAKLKAGLNIYQTVAAATGCQQFVFGYDSNFTIGYLLSLP
jgi:hypothetical protein